MIFTRYDTFTRYETTQNNAVALSLYVSIAASDFASTVYTAGRSAIHRGRERLRAKVGYRWLSAIRGARKPRHSRLVEGTRTSVSTIFAEIAHVLFYTTANSHQKHEARGGS